MPDPVVNQTSELHEVSMAPLEEIIEHAREEDDFDGQEVLMDSNSNKGAKTKVSNPKSS